MNQKVGLEYFRVECATDNRVQLVIAEYGLQAFAIYIGVLKKIFGGEGYYCKWNREVALLFAQEYSAGYNSVSRINEILLCYMRRGVFSRKQFEENGILTSEEIQLEFLEAVSRRKIVKMKKAYLLVKVALLPENVDIIPQNVSILDENVDILKQSREEYINKKNIYGKLPTLEEVRAYIDENGIKGVNAEQFYSYYQLKGWKTNDGVQVADWKAAIDYWKLNHQQQNRGSNSNTQKHPTAQRPRAKKNQFNSFEQREASREDMDALERKMLGLS